jgi:hypothetical protein
MSYVIYSIQHDAPVARFDWLLCDLTLRKGEVAIPCQHGDDPNDLKWGTEATAINDTERPD